MSKSLSFQGFMCPSQPISQSLDGFYDVEILGALHGETCACPPMLRKHRSMLRVSDSTLLRVVRTTNLLSNWSTLSSTQFETKSICPNNPHKVSTFSFNYRFSPEKCLPQKESPKRPPFQWSTTGPSSLCEDLTFGTSHNAFARCGVGCQLGICGLMIIT